MRWLILFFFLILSTQIVLGVNCDNIKEGKVKACKDAINMLNESAKEELVLAMLNEHPETPDFEFINGWNSNISFNRAPNGVASLSSSYIKDSWLRILSVNPSVENKKTLYAPSTGQILSAYNYRVDVPSGNVNGDCLTDYRLVTNNAFLDIYSNRTLIGHGRRTDFNINSDSSFVAVLRIDVTITANHHKEVKYCCSSNRRGCTGYCTECRYQNTDYLTDFVELRDSVNVTFYPSNLNYSFSWVGRNKENGKIRIKNQTAIKLLFENSSYYENPFAFKLVAKFKPYDILSYRALNQPQIKSRNIRYNRENESLYFAAVGKSCSLELRDYFSSLKANCSSFNSSKLTLSTDKLVYLNGDLINVYVESVKPVQLNYGNSTFSGNDNFTLTASYSNNIISVTNGDSKDLAVISVQNRNKLSLAFLVAAFSAMNYAAYVFLRRLWPF